MAEQQGGDDAAAKAVADAAAAKDPAAAQKTPEQIKAAEAVTAADTAAAEAAKQSGNGTGKEGEKGGSKTLLGGAGNKEGEGRQGAPDSYEAYKLPEGFAMAEDVGKDYNALAKKHDLSQAAAQDFVDFQSKLSKQLTDRGAADYDARVKAWQEESGKFLGAEKDAKLALASKAMEKFSGGKELQTFLDESGLGDNPLIVKFMVAVGEANKEDVPPGGDPTNEGKKTDAQLFYPKMYDGKDKQTA